jgi:CheY-like chemotaxis protein
MRVRTHARGKNGTDAIGEPAHTPAPKMGARAHRLRVLLADDDYEVRCALTRILELDGYEVVSVASGTELLDSIGTQMLGGRGFAPIDAIVTDVRMPGWNGLRILEGLRAGGFAKPVVVITAFGDGSMRSRVERLGRAVFLGKPFEPAELERALARMVAD